jgi:hypothetical protein
VLWQGRAVASGFAAHVFGNSSEFVEQFLAGTPEGPLGMD